MTLHHQNARGTGTSLYVTTAYLNPVTGGRAVERIYFHLTPQSGEGWNHRETLRHAITYVEAMNLVDVLTGVAETLPRPFSGKFHWGTSTLWIAYQADPVPSYLLEIGNLEEGGHKELKFRLTPAEGRVLKLVLERYILDLAKDD